MYGNKKKTLREISKNPENMTEEERKDMAELFASLKEVGKACEPYDIKTIRKNTVNTPLLISVDFPNRLRPYITTNEDFSLARASFRRAASSILSTNFIYSTYYALQT